MAVSLLRGGTAFAQGLAELDCREADRYVAQQRPAWYSVWTDLEVDTLLAESVIYPELIRYSAWQDRIEEGIVASTYISMGKDGADFSIGHFQMKASFVESLEKHWVRSSLRDSLQLYFDTRQTQMARKARIGRLRDPFWQSVYLGLFLKLLYLDLPDLNGLPMSEQVQLCAAAYNHGVKWEMPKDELLEHLYRWSTQRTFHLDLLPTPLTTRYSYADIAWEHYSLVKANGL